jgi:hypothetical protein
VIYLVGSLVKLLGVERTTKTQGDTLAEEDVVGDGGNTAVVDLDLFCHIISQISFFRGLNHAGFRRSRVDMIDRTLVKETGSMRYLVATSRPTVLPVLEFQVALAPASTWLLTLW